MYLDSVEYLFMVQIQADDEHDCGAPKCLKEDAEVGVHEANLVVPREEIVSDCVGDKQEDAVHACRGE